MLTHNYSYEATLADSVKVNWQVNDLIGGTRRSTSRSRSCPSRSRGVRAARRPQRAREAAAQPDPRQQLPLPVRVRRGVHPARSSLDEARAAMPGGEPIEVRALMTFAEEEAKHIHLFQRFARGVQGRLPHAVRRDRPAPRMSRRSCCSHSRLGVALLTLHLEWMTQSHYLDSVKDDQDLDPQFKSLLRHHWMEERSTRSSTRMLVDKLAREGGAAAIEKAFADFAALGGAIDGLLQQQVQLDLDVARGGGGPHADRRRARRDHDRADARVPLHVPRVGPPAQELPRDVRPAQPRAARRRCARWPPRSPRDRRIAATRAAPAIRESHRRAGRQKQVTAQSQSIRLRGPASLLVSRGAKASSTVGPGRSFGRRRRAHRLDAAELV